MPSSPSPFVLPAQASTGFHNATAYDQHRPSYPPALLSAFLSHLNLAAVPGAHILELGAGTGKFTVPLAARPEAYDIVAVEPHAQMRAALRDKKLSNVSVCEGDAEHVPLEEGWADACVVAQAFHWFATPAALREIARVLKPGAVLGMIWNVEYYNAPLTHPTPQSWMALLKSHLYTHEDSAPRFRHMEWQRVFSSQHLFSVPLSDHTVEWTVYLSDSALWERYATLSQIANLSETPAEGGSEKERCREWVMQALGKGDTVRNERGEVRVDGVTYFAWTRRL